MVWIILGAFVYVTIGAAIAILSFTLGLNFPWQVNVLLVFFWPVALAGILVAQFLYWLLT